MFEDDIVSWLPTESKEQKPTAQDKKRNMHNGHDDAGRLNAEFNFTIVSLKCSKPHLKILLRCTPPLRRFFLLSY